MKVGSQHFRTVWYDDAGLNVIDQRLLPHSFQILRLATHRDTALAISDMTVRGAGAIGATGGFGMAQGFLEAPDATFESYIQAAAACLRATRPTAQNLFYAIDRVLRAGYQGLAQSRAQARAYALAEAQRVADDDARACERIGELGEALIPEGARVSTHCNAGWLAFVDWGSALSPLYQAVRRGKKVSVLVDETRPRSQGARLTAWELRQEGIPFHLVTDGVSASLMARGEVDLVIVGSDRIARNGDVANKIGTYPAALAAREAGIPFYVAAPSSTIDPHCPSGQNIPIEERSGDEVLWVEGRDPSGTLTRVFIAPEGTSARNPAFDVTPAALIRGIITEFGVVPASEEGIGVVLEKKRLAMQQASIR